MSNLNKKIFTQLLVVLVFGIVVIILLICQYDNNIVTLKISSEKFAVPKTDEQYTDSDRNHVIHICTTICGLRVKDALVMMWSALVFTAQPIHFHLIVSKEVKPRIMREVTSWHQWKINFTLYDTVVPWNQSSRDLMFHKAMIRPCTSQRLFLPDIITTTNRILYVDTDVIFMTSADQLWVEFSQFDYHQGAGFVFESETPRGIYQTSLGYPFYRPHGLNAGVFLMDLSVMRRNYWSKEIQAIYISYKDRLLYSDQDVINIYFERHRELLHQLPCSFNYRPSHCDPKAYCFTTNKSNHHIALIHGSSQAFIMRSSKKRAFYDIYNVFSKALQRQDFDPHNIIRGIKDLFQQNSYTTCTQLTDIMAAL